MCINPYKLSESYLHLLASTMHFVFNLIRMLEETADIVHTYVTYIVCFVLATAANSYPVLITSTKII